MQNIVKPKGLTAGAAKILRDQNHYPISFANEAGELDGSDDPALVFGGFDEALRELGFAVRFGDGY
jgi:hypothetical protein